MAKALKETIKDITYTHLKKYKSFVFGQNLTGVGWVGGTLPKLYEKDGVIELPTSDVASGGFVTGAGLMGKRPIYIIRYQGFNWFNCIFIINYACKSKSIWKISCPIFIRGMSNEGSIGPVAGSSQLSIFYKMPGIKIVSPMTSNEYKKAYEKFIKNDDVMYVSEHRESYNRTVNLLNKYDRNPDFILMPISVTRFEAEKARIKLLEIGIKVGVVHIVWLKPFKLSKKIVNYLNTVKKRIIVLDNDFVDGIPRTIAHQISLKVNKKVEVMGLENKTAGHHKNVDNLPPSYKKIINNIKRLKKSI